ncbi:kinase [Rossellomorea sp. YZS02]|uniref:kinase n=1 Tax=Rossellomorea sp. YZS02 TaxID=3097358 RepID=UPI002A12B511|nr:kinase [Rossellomorea sp. YZS02]MDX8343553.1 kinase [Rossellomorea sp. YZS02]
MKDLLREIGGLFGEGRFVLGIDGLSRSGKTTFVDELSRYLNKESRQYYIFHLDDLIVERNRRYDTGFAEWYEYFHLQWDVEWLSEHFFRRLRGNEQLTLPIYQNHSDAHENRTIQLPKEGLIIIEGVFLQRKEWKGFFDRVVYLDCPRATRFERESFETKQNVLKFENRYWKAEEYYENRYKPAETADIVINSKDGRVYTL